MICRCNIIEREGGKPKARENALKSKGKAAIKDKKDKQKGQAHAKRQGSVNRGSTLPAEQRLY